MGQREIMATTGYIPVSEAADKAGVSVFTVYNWLRSGKVKSTKSGDRLYVQLSSLIAHLGPVVAETMGLVSENEEREEVPQEGSG